MSHTPEEQWFLDHGLPYFVDSTRAAVLARLSRRAIVVVVVIAVLLGVLAGVAVGLASGEGDWGTVVGVAVVLVAVSVYALRALEAATITRWALRRTFRSLGLLLPLATRALPMLLLFITFLFINTEVWQVASALSRGVLWGTVLFFTVAAVFFLVARLAQELHEFDSDVPDEVLLATTKGTVFEAGAVELAESDAPHGELATVGGLQRANLVLALVITQAVQVLLLALAVFAFFMVFGLVAIDDSVIHSWVGGDAPTYLGSVHVFSVELTQVSIFLAGFSGLYFTVTAVTDEVYRREFFTRVRRELERAVSTRIVYRHQVAENG